MYMYQSGGNKMEDRNHKWIPDRDFFARKLKTINRQFAQRYEHPYNVLGENKGGVRYYPFMCYESDYIPFLLKELGLEGLCLDGANNLLTANRTLQQKELKSADLFGFRSLIAADAYMTRYANLYAKRMKQGIKGEMFTIMEEMYYAYRMLEESVHFKEFNYLVKDYLLLKLTEFSILNERQKYIAEEEERKRRLREEEKALRELKKEAERAEKDENKARESIEKSREALLKAKTDAQISKLNAQIAELEVALQRAIDRKNRAISMAQQTRCGYVYVISNVGSFGEGIYKIGMTRRIEPMMRVRELGDASVPFPFDVHAMIYTEDAPGLESHLHRVFDLYKVNAVNWRKEYFRISLDRIREEVESFGIYCDWKETPVAEQYHDSEWIRNIGNMDAAELHRFSKEHPDRLQIREHAFDYNPFDSLDED